MSYQSWADAAREVIQAEMAKHPHLKGKELKAILSKAYPFGERQYHPYKVWLREVKRAVEGKLFAKPQVCRAVPVLPGQGVLL